jgi:hypothetical protein
MATQLSVATLFRLYRLYRRYRLAWQRLSAVSR